MHQQNTLQQLALPGRIILVAAEGKNTCQIARELAVSVDTVCQWRTRWIGFQAALLEDVPISERLTVAPRLGWPAQITAEQPAR